MPSYKVYEKPSKWLRKGGAPTRRSHFIADRIIDALFTTTLNVRNLHQFVFDDDVVTEKAGGPVNIVLQALKPWPGIDDLKVNINLPFIVILYDEKTLKPSGQLEHGPDFFEIAFFAAADGKGPRRSMLRTDLMEIKDLTSDLVKNITDLNSDNALENQWTLKNLAEEAKKDQSMSDSSLGEWEQGYIIGQALEWTEIEFIPFANWNILPPFLHDPELQAQCEHEWRKAAIPFTVERDGSDAGLPADGIKEIWVCEECDLMVDENPEGEPEEDKDEDEAVDAAKDERREKMLKIWDEKERERKRKGKSPYDDPPWGDPWKEKSPWKPNPYEPYKPSEDGWDKWVKYNPWMAKYCPDCEDDEDKKYYGEAAANA
jgi:hypothetical protein